MGVTSFVDLTGRVFGRWTVLSRCIDRPKYWRCRCACGNLKEVNGGNLRQGQTNSCGCWNAESTARRLTTHGQTGTRAHNIWLCMKDRCLNPRNDRYEDYGGRGIRISPEWRDSFSAFLADMGHPPKGYSLERIDNDGNYEAKNCRWIPRSMQSRNKRKTVRISAFGREMLQADWARLLGVNSSHIWYATNKGRGIEWLAARRGIEVAIG
jgi:hypothetical protein